MKKIWNFLFGHIGYRVYYKIYEDDRLEPCKGYVLYYEYRVFGIPCQDLIAIAHDKEHMQKHLDIRKINIDFA